MKTCLTAALTVTLSILLSSVSFAQVPDHFHNDPANLNPNPDYTPGAYALPDTHDAKTYYQVKKEELLSSVNVKSDSALFSVGLGDIMFTSYKNETAKVLGYFRQYQAVAKTNGSSLEQLNIVIDVNSMDTAVGGRNNRILDIFFQSMKPELGTIEISLSQFEKTDINTRATGMISLNGVTNPVTLDLNVSQTDGTWLIETTSPLNLLISDYNFGNRVYDLMKECNHKAIGNTVEVKGGIYLR